MGLRLAHNTCRTARSWPGTLGGNPGARLHVALLVLLALAALACLSAWTAGPTVPYGEEQYPTRTPVPALALPGVSPLPGVTAFAQRIGFPFIPGSFDAYRAPDSSPRLVSWDGGTRLYDIGLDGGDPHLLATLPTVCRGLLAVTPDQHWVTCALSTGLVRVPLGLPGEQQPGLIPQSPAAGAAQVDQAWSPDGQRVAIATMDSGTCSLAFYAWDAAHTTLGLVATLAFPEFTEPPSSGVVCWQACDVVAPAWSPDGSRLAFAAYPEPSLTRTRSRA
jgi:hypothetical protein